MLEEIIYYINSNFNFIIFLGVVLLIIIILVLLCFKGSEILEYIRNINSGLQYSKKKRNLCIYITGSSFSPERWIYYNNERLKKYLKEIEHLEIFQFLSASLIPFIDFNNLEIKKLSIIYFCKEQRLV